MTKSVAERTSARRGIKGDPTHISWRAMRGRCMHTGTRSYAEYGGRGIRVCERWQTFANFLEDMGPRPSASHSIDRIDNDGNYEPGNCRWATASEQSRGRRDRVPISAHGRTMFRIEWSKETGIAMTTINQRLVRGWTPERAVTEPVRWRGGDRSTSKPACIPQKAGQEDA